VEIKSYRSNGKPASGRPRGDHKSAVQRRWCNAIFRKALPVRGWGRPQQSSAVPAVERSWAAARSLKPPIDSPMFECAHPLGMQAWTDWRGMAPRRRPKIFPSAVARPAGTCSYSGPPRRIYRDHCSFWEGQSRKLANVRICPEVGPSPLYRARSIDYRHSGWFVFAPGEINSDKFQLSGPRPFIP
jgi:hypothetical protein